MVANTLRNYPTKEDLRTALQNYATKEDLQRELHGQTRWIVGVLLMGLVAIVAILGFLG